MSVYNNYLVRQNTQIFRYLMESLIRPKLKTLGHTGKIKSGSINLSFLELLIKNGFYVYNSRNCKRQNSEIVLIKQELFILRHINKSVSICIWNIQSYQPLTLTSAYSDLRQISIIIIITYSLKRQWIIILVSVRALPIFII